MGELKQTKIKTIFITSGLTKSERSFFFDMTNVFKLYNLGNKDCINIQADCNLLMFILDGEALLAGLKEGSILDIKNSIVLLPITSNILVRSKDKAQILTIPFDLTNYFSVEYTQRLLSFSNKNNPPAISLLNNLTPFLSSVVNYIEDGIDMTDLSKILTKELFLILNLYYPDEDISLLFSPILNTDLAFKQIVMSNCLLTDNLDNLAALTKYSKSGFIKKFHRCFGMPPHKWILQYKAKRILQEIQLSNKRFSTIAEEHGINNLSYFYTFCKKHFGKSPSNLRKAGKSLLK